MAYFPKVFDTSRRIALAAVITSSLLQALLAVVIAFRMRDLFAAFSENINLAVDLPCHAILSIALASVGIILLRVIEKSAAEMAAQNFVKELRVKLFNRISRMSNTQLNTHKAGSLQIRFVGDLSAVKNWVGIAIPGLITAICLTPALIFLLYTLHPIMAALGAATAIVSIVTMQFAAPKLRNFHQNLRSQRGGLASFMAARISQANYLRVLGMRKQIVKQIESRSAHLSKYARHKTAAVYLFKSIPELALQVLAISCLAISILLGMTAAQGAIVLAILAIFQQPMKDLAGFWDKRHAYVVSRRKCTQILRTKSVTSGVKLPMPRDVPLSFEMPDLQFKGSLYPDVHLQFGDKLLVSGMSGSGKTTFLELITGLQEKDKGDIRAHGIALQEMREQDKASLLYYQGPTIPIFGGSLRATLTFGIHRRVASVALTKMIEKVGLSETSKRLGGLKGKVLEYGRNLSAGEIEKVAICRILLSSAKVLLIDDFERFSHAANTELLNKLFNNKDKTLICCTRESAPLIGSFDQQIELKARV